MLLRTASATGRHRTLGRAGRSVTLLATAVVAASTVLYAVSSTTAAPEAAAASGTVNGTVFVDYNRNGLKDAGSSTASVASATDVGIAGVTVRITDAAGAITTTTTNSAGVYTTSVTTPAANAAVRIEIVPPAGFTEGPKGTDSGTTIQFGTVGAATLTANVGLVRPGDYSQNTPGLLLVQAMAAIGTANNGAGGLFSNATRATQASLTNSGYADRRLTVPTVEATIAQTGSIWGVTQYNRQYAFTAAHFKRHARLGGAGVSAANALGQIYLTTIGGAADATPFVTIPNAGTNPRLAAYNITDESQMTADNYFHDQTAFNQAGKIGLGGITMAPDRRALFVVNLNDKNLYKVPLSFPGGVPTAGTPQAIPLPVLPTTGGTACAAANTRPFGVTAQNGAVWITLTCTGPAASDLRGYVYRYDLAAGTFGQVFTTPLSGYNRGTVYTSITGTWNVWTADNAWVNSATGNNQMAGHPQPLLSDVVFDSNGDMSIGIKDRFSDQVGYEAGNLTAGSSSTYEGFAGGDTLRACLVGAVFVQESNAVCGTRTGYGAGNNQGPGGGEFYSDDYTSTHQQVSLGGLLQIPGYGQLLNTTYDPGADVRSQGYRFFSNVDGGYGGPTGDNWHTVLTVVNEDGSGAQGSFAKGGGLGDLTSISLEPPLEIGNRVWLDANRNGIQDPGELPIAGVSLSLLSADGATNYGTTTTSPAGEYYFTDANTNNAMTPNTSFIVRVNTPNFTAGSPLAGLIPALATQGADALIDSNGVVPAAPAGVVQAAVTTGDFGVNDHSIDFGFHTPVYAVGDVAFRDLNRDGRQNSGELPVAGMTVALQTSAGATVPDGNGNTIPTTTTDTNGHYVFDNVPAGTYRIVFTGVPAGYVLTTQNALGSTPDNDSDPRVDTGITSSFVLGPISPARPEMAAIAAGDLTTKAVAINRTIDAGIVQVVYGFGNQVFFDSNKNGIQEVGEAGLNNYTVNLFQADGTTPALNSFGNQVAATTTNLLGIYNFDNLPPGIYRAKFSGLNGGRVFTLQTAGGSTQANDSNVDAAGLTGPFTLGPVGASLPNMQAVAPGDPYFYASAFDPTVDAGVMIPDAYALGDVAFYDDNRNGIQDAGEPGVAGMAVQLRTAANAQATTIQGNPVPPTLTDSAGHYVFDNLPAGSYYVIFGNRPAGFTFTNQSVAGSTAANDSNANSVGQTPVVAIGPGQPNMRAVVAADGTSFAVAINPTVDAGIVSPLAVGDYVWYDTNKNGIQDSGELPVVGATVTLYQANGTTPAQDLAGATVPAATTDAAGRYVFDNLAAGTYTVRFTTLPTGYMFTQTGAGTTLTDSNPALTGLTPAFTLTRLGADVRPAVIGDSLSGGPLLATHINPGIDAGIILSPAYAIGDFVWYDVNGNGRQDSGEPPVVGQQVTLLNPDGTVARDLIGNLVPPTFTDGLGHYVFDNLAAGPYQVQFGTPPTGYVFTTRDAAVATDLTDSDPAANGRTATVVVGPGLGDTPVPSDNVTQAVLINRTVDAGVVAPIAIGDVVWYDLDKDGIQDNVGQVGGEPTVAGATVTLYNADGVTRANNAAGTQVPLAVTGADGRYVFDNLAPGTYVVGFSTLPTGYILTNQAVGANTDIDSDPAGGATTGRTGTVGIQSAAGGSVRVVVAADGALIAHFINPTIDAGIIPAPAYAVGDYVFYDNNGNGIQDAGDAPLGGLSVQLLTTAGANATNALGALVTPTFTDGFGHYVFDNLAPGDYQVQFGTPPAKHYFTPALTGTDRGVDSNAVPATGRTATFSIGAGTPNNAVPVGADGTTVAVGINRTIDAGVIPVLAVGDYVWRDTDKDGVQDSGEPALAGFTVQLQTTAGVRATNRLGAPIPDATTDAAGHYVFDNLAPGNYRVQFSGLTTGYIFTTPLATGSGLDSNPAANGITGNFALTGSSADTRVAVAADGAPLAARIDPTIDAGIIPAPAYAVGDIVFRDNNNNGIQDAGDTVVPGITVTLLVVPAGGGPAVPALDSFGNPVPPTVSGPDGKYVFDNLPPGNYQVQFGTLPTGYEYVTPGAGTPANDSNPASNGLTPVFPVGPGAANQTPTVPADGLVAGVINPTIDAGVRPSPAYAIGNYTFYDNNNNGIQDAGDTPLAGITVSLFTGTGAPAVDAFGVTVPTQLSSPTGAYVFDNLAPGSYQVQFGAAPAGYFRTLADVAGAPTADTDSDANATTGRTATFSIGNGVGNTLPKVVADGTLIAVGIDRTIDAGYSTVYAVGDYVFYDNNKNGTQEPGESGVPGVVVSLRDGVGGPAVDADGVLVPDVITVAGGRYVFDNLLPGNYLVAFSNLPTGYMFTGAGVGADRSDDSNPELSGLTPFFTVGVAQPNTRPVNAALDGNLDAVFIDPTVDAGIHLSPAYAVGDFVFLDNNGNGLQDAGDDPIPGVTVTLLSGGVPAVNLIGQSVPPVQTGPDGSYLFDNLAAGSYTITFTTTPVGYSFTAPGAGPDRALDSNPNAAGLTPPFTLGTGAPNMIPADPSDNLAAVAVNPTIDAGMTAVYAIGDYVFYDTGTINGVQDAGETGVAGATVTLYLADGSTRAVDTDGVLVPVYVTAANGKYVFDNIVPGSYVVGFSTLPTGYRFTQQGAGTAATDSNPNAAGLSAPFVVGPISATRPNMRTAAPATDGTTLAVAIDPTIDAGIILSDAFAIGDKVFYDDDRDGVQDAGEPGVPGITVTLLDSSGNSATDLIGNPVPPTTTGPNGQYLFDNLAEGSYIVEFSGVDPKYSFSDQQVGTDVTVDSNPDSTGRTPVITIGTGVPGTVPVDPADPLAAVGLNPTVDAGIVTSLAVGDFVWYDVDKNGIQDGTLTPVFPVTVELLTAAGGAALDVDGVAVPSTQTDAAGHYAFDNLPGGSYRVRFSDLPTGYMFTLTGTGGGLDSNPDATGLTPVFVLSRTGSDVRNVVAGDTGVAIASRIDPTIDAGIHLSPAYAIGDYVFVDNNGNGIQDNGDVPVPGATVTLRDVNGNPADDAIGNPVLPVITDGNGHYVFDNLAPGDYVVVVTNPLPGSEFSTPNVVDPTAPVADEVDSDVDRSGTSGTVTIGPDAPGTRTPVDGDGVEVAVGINPTVDAGIVPRLSLGNYVWFDTGAGSAAANGVQNSDELPVEGVTVTLLDGNGNPAKDFDGVLVPTTTTDEDGLYVFDNLYPGSYQVAFSTLPIGWMITTPLAGGDRLVDSDPVVATGTTATFTLFGTNAALRAPNAAEVEAGVTQALSIDPSIDAGLVPAPQYSIGDYVFVDNNANGVQDAPDQALPGVTVTLLDGAGNPAVDAFGNPVLPVVSGPNGEYLFDQLAPGSYQVVFSNTPPGHEFTNPLLGGLETDSDANSNGVTGIVVIGPGEDNQIPVEPSGDPLNTTVELNPTVDAGVVPRLAIGDYAWYDSNRDGAQQENEPVLAGATVTLLTGAGLPAFDFEGAPVPATSTDENGHYVFDNLRPNNYQVVFSDLPQGWIFTTPVADGVDPADNSDARADGSTVPFDLFGSGVNVRPTLEGDGAEFAVQIDPTLDAGIIPAPAYAIGDYVWFDQNKNGLQDADELPVVDLPVTLMSATGDPVTDIFGAPLPSTVTDADGLYVFDNLAPGSYTVQFGTPPTGYEFTTVTVDPALGETDSNADVSGLTGVIEIGDGVPGTQPVGDDQGFLIAVGINPTVDAGLAPSAAYAVGDLVWIDNNGSGIQDAGDTVLGGVTVTLFADNGTDKALDSFGNPVPATVTDADGRYVFDNLPAGAYVVMVTDVPAGHVFTAPTVGTDPAVDSTTDLRGITLPFTIGPDGENTRPVEAGDGALIAGAIDPTIDAGLLPLLAVGDYVWYDTNRDGVQDKTEKPVANVTVTLLDSLGTDLLTTSTDSDGHYVFDGLVPGSYLVSFSDLPDGYVFTGALASVGTAASDSDPELDGLTGEVVLVGGAAGNIRAVADTDGTELALWIDPTVDAGIVAVSFAVGDTVWVDVDKDGLQDPTEPGLPGVSVEITDPSGDPVQHSDGGDVDPTVTDSDGHYVFDDLPPGDYQVVFGDLPKDTEFTTPLVSGGSPEKNSDATANGVTATFTIDIGEPLSRERTEADGDLIATFIDSTRDAGVIDPEVTTNPEEEMPNTGVAAGPQLLTALLLLLAGAALVLAGRRRRGADLL